MRKNDSTAARLGEAVLPEKYSPRGVAEIVNETVLLARLPVSRRTLHSWRATGKLPYVRVPGSRRVLYHWPSVEAALLRLQRGGGQ